MKDFLDRHFPQFEPELKARLEEQGVLREIAEGERVMQAGQYIKSTVLVVDGRLKLYRENEEGKEFFMYYITPGSACALSMVCAAKQEQIDVVALADERSTLIMLPTQIMDELMRDYKSWYYFVLETYRNRFEELLDLVDNVAFNNMDERLLAYLKNHKEKLGTSTVQATHQTIANDLNSSREVVSRLLKKMEQQGWVRLGRNVIELLV